MSFKENLQASLIKYAFSDNNTNQQSVEPALNAELPEPFEIGKAFYVETYTKYWHFHVLGFTKDGLLKVQNLSWIANTGKYSTGLKNNGFDEIESVDGIFYLPFQGFTLIKETPLITLSTK